MSAKSMHELKDMLCQELDQIVKKGSISRSELETVSYLTDSIKNVMKINEMEEGGYSYGMGGWNANGRYSNNGSYADGMNDSYGRYSRDGGSYNDGDTMSGRYHYVRGHYSRAEDENSMLTERIEEMMNNSRLSVDDKSTLRRAMDILRK